jgi:hypothetical protein
MEHQPPYPQDIDWNDHFDWDEPASPEESDKATILRLQNEMTYLKPSGQRAAAALALSFYDQTDSYPIVEITLNDAEYILQPTIELIQQLSPNARIEFVKWLLDQEGVWTDIDTGIAEAVAAEAVAAETGGTKTVAEEISTSVHCDSNSLHLEPPDPQNFDSMFAFWGAYDAWDKATDDDVEPSPIGTNALNPDFDPIPF